MTSYVCRQETGRSVRFRRMGPTNVHAWTSLGSSRSTRINFQNAARSVRQPSATTVSMAQAASEALEECSIISKSSRPLVTLSAIEHRDSDCRVRAGPLETHGAREVSSNGQFVQKKQSRCQPVRRWTQRQRYFHSSRARVDGQHPEHLSQVQLRLKFTAKLVRKLGQ